MAANNVQRVKTISEYHQLRGLPMPEHPLISLINFDSLKHLPIEPSSWRWIFIPLQ